MGLIYPDRRKSNNMVYNVTTMGIINKIILKENEGLINQTRSTINK
uniref:Uncharacterized protein n=1 Tax=Populus trichocarpa TaxID=3694 RepID=A0A2K1YHW3_POPTR